MTTVHEEQQKFSDEYHTVIRKSLSEVSNTFESINYEIQDGKFKMKWQHGSIPTLDFNFSIIFNEENVCEIEFVIDTFLAQVPEKLQESMNSEQNAAIIHQIQKCSDKITQKISGPDAIKYDGELLVEGHNFINDNNLTDVEKKDVQRAILLQEPDLIQQKIIENPTQVLKDLKQVEAVIENDDLTMEDKEQIKSQILETPITKENKYSSEYSSDFHSYQSSEKESTETHKGDKVTDFGFEFSHDQQSIEEDIQVENSDQQSEKEDDRLNSILKRMDFTDFSEEDSYDFDINPPKLERRNAINLGKKYDCSAIDKVLIKEKIKILQLENYLQDVKLFDENIVKCLKGKGAQMSTVLTFNREQCYLSIDGTYESGYKMMNEFDKESFGINLDHKIINCVYRFGTMELKTN